MSKLNLRLSYKNACILKHKLRESIRKSEKFISENINGYTEASLKKANKELEEERRALVAITEEINLGMHRH